MPAEYVYDLSASDVAKLAEQCDRLRASIELLESAIEKSEALKSETSLSWLSSKLKASLDVFAGRLFSAGRIPAPADVQACVEGDGPLVDFFRGIVAVIEFAERYGAEARSVHVILLGMKAVTDSLLSFLRNECQTRPLPPVGFRFRQLRQGLPQRQPIEAEVQPRPDHRDRFQIKGTGLRSFHNETAPGKDSAGSARSS